MTTRVTEQALPRVLVLLATCNGHRWVESQLETIVRQVNVQVTLSIRDDASNDGTPARVRGALEGISGWTLECSERGSGSAAANFFALIAGCRPAGHDYVALADQDDLWDDDKLSCAVQLLRRSGADGYSAAVRAQWPDGRVRVLRQSVRIRAADFLFEGAGQGCSFVLTAEAFSACRDVLIAHPQECGRIHYHDWALYALLRAAGRRWQFDPLPHMSYRQHAANDTGARSGVRGRQRRIAQIRSGWYAEQIRAILDLVSRAEGETPQPLKMYGQLSTVEPPWKRRACRVLFVLRHGRRRRIDRLVLAWAAWRDYLD